MQPITWIIFKLTLQGHFEVLSDVKNFRETMPNLSSNLQNVYRNDNRIEFCMYFMTWRHHHKFPHTTLSHAHPCACVDMLKVKVKVHTLDKAPLRSESPLQKRSGMARVLSRDHSFTCTPTRSSAIGMSHTCLCLPIRSWYSFTDPGGTEGWVDLEMLVMIRAQVNEAEKYLPLVLRTDIGKSNKPSDMLRCVH